MYLNKLNNEKLPIDYKNINHNYYDDSQIDFYRHEFENLFSKEAIFKAYLKAKKGKKLKKKYIILVKI